MMSRGGIGDGQERQLASGCLTVVAGVLAITAAAVYVGAKAGVAYGLMAWLTIAAVAVMAWAMLLVADRGE